MVDDQQSVLMTIDSLLTGQGHAVTCVDNAHDAVDKLMKLPFDLMITDLVMPGGSGMDLIRFVKNEKKLQGLRIMMLSGRREKKDVEAGIRAGAEDYIVKPIDPEIIVAKVNAVVSKTPGAASKFAEVVVAEPFNWEMKNEIIRISEIGVTILTGMSIEAGTKVRISSVLLDKLGLRNVHVRVISCQRSGSEPPLYTVVAHFIGLTEEMLQPLRVYIRNNQKISA